MTKKRLPARRAASPQPNRQGWGKRILLVLSLLPIIAGLLLIGLAMAGYFLWGFSMLGQISAGVLITLVSFAAANAVQKEWTLAAGWLLLGVALWLGANLPETWSRITALVLAGAGVGLVGKEFARRLPEHR